MVQDVATSVVIWIIGFLVGTVAISLGAQLVVDRDTGFTRAAVAALVGAGLWALTSYFVGGIPLLGPVLMLLVWIGSINWTYPGGWGTATGIGVVAWIAAVVLMAGLGALGIVTPDALGIPGV